MDGIDILKVITNVKSPSRDEREDNIREKFLKFVDYTKQNYNSRADEKYEEELSKIFGLADDSAENNERVLTCTDMLDEYSKANKHTVNNHTYYYNDSVYTDPLKSSLTNVNVRHNQERYI